MELSPTPKVEIADTEIAPLAERHCLLQSWQEFIVDIVEDARQ